jgi:tRNA A37 threonylcarbamoyladenosine synthetase subunit TsaC/SUA5/YrdC
VDSIDAALREKVDVILDADQLEEQPVSTIIRVENNTVDVVRDGAIPAAEIGSHVTGEVRHA